MINFTKMRRLFLNSMADGIVQSRKLKKGRIAECFSDVEIYTKEIKKENEKEIINISVFGDLELSNIFCSEANRFFLASIASYLRSLQIQSENASWQIIELYYAAYFSINYLMRISGFSITNFEAKDIDHIVRSYMSIHPNAVRPSRGMYILEYNNDDKELLLQKLEKKGGSHQAAWAVWFMLVEKMRRDAEKDEEEYLNESLFLSEHLRFLGQKDSCNFPKIRGQINYQFKGKSWFFEEKSEVSVRAIQKILSKDSNFNEKNIESNVTKIINNSIFLVHFSNNIFLKNCQEYPRSISNSIKNKYNSLLNMV